MRIYQINHFALSDSFFKKKTQTGSIDAITINQIHKLVINLNGKICSRHKLIINLTGKICSRHRYGVMIRHSANGILALIRKNAMMKKHDQHNK